MANEHIYLSRFTGADAAFILELLNTPGWMQQIGDRGIKNEGDALVYIRNGPCSSYEKNGFGLMAVRLSQNDTPIGMCGLIKRDTLDHADLGFALLPEYEGKGYAYEAAKVTLQEASSLGMQKLLAITLPTNQRSVSLLKRMGFILEKMIVMPGGDEELMLLGIDL